MRRLLFTGISAALVATLAACGGGSSDDAATATPVTPSAVAATPTKAASPSPQATASAQATPSAPAPTPSPTAPAETATATAPAPTNPPANQPAATPVPPTPTPPPASTNPLAATIGVTAAGSSYFWAPASVKVAPGATVTWTWSGNVPHNVEGPGFGLAPTDYKNADTVSFTFSGAGTYNFSCGTHPTMRGKVIVE